MSLGLFNCRLIQPARDQLFFFAGCLAAPVPVRASSVQSPCDASCSAPTSGRVRNASCVFPSQEGFVLVFRGSEAPVGCRRVHPTDSPTNSPEDPPILPIDSAIEPDIESFHEQFLSVNTPSVLRFYQWFQRGRGRPPNALIGRGRPPNALIVTVLCEPQ